MHWSGRFGTRPCSRWTAILVLTVVFGPMAALASISTAQGQESSLRANIAAWRSEEGVLEFCVDLRDTVAGETRQCPDRRRLTPSRAPQNRWVRSRSIDVAPEVSVWLRVRRVGDRLDLGLGVSNAGRARGLRASSWVLHLETLPTARWLRTSTVTLQLPVAPHPELWPPTLGIVAGAARLEVGKVAPPFKLPVLDSEDDAVLSLSDIRTGDEKLTLIVFWASWAPFVGETLSVLGDLAAREDNVLVLGINVYEVSDGAGEEFVENYGTDLLHLVDADGSVAQHYRVDGVPELFVIDSDGIYRGVIRGAAPLTEILSAIYGVE